MEPVVVIVGIAVALAVVMGLFGGGAPSRRAGHQEGMVDDGDDGDDGGDGGGGDGGD